MPRTPASPAVVARAHQIADQLGRAKSMAEFCAVLAVPDVLPTLVALEKDGGYPKTTAHLREAFRLCKAAARPGASSLRKRPGAVRAPASAPPGKGEGKAAMGPARGPLTSPGGQRGGTAFGGKGTAPGGRRFGPTEPLFGGFPWYLFLAAYLVLKDRD